MKEKTKKPFAMRNGRLAKRKRQRLAREAARNKLAATRKRLRSDVQIAAVAQPSQERVVIGVTSGTFGSPHGVTFNLSNEAIVGTVEDNRELGTLVTNLGLMVLAALVRHDLAGGTEGLAKKLAKFAHIDLELLAVEAAAQAKADEESIKVDPPEYNPEQEGVVL